MFFNTTNETNKILQDSKKKALSQNDKILKIFEKYPFLEFTPFEIQERLGANGTPITSVRRALTTLTKENKIRKTKFKKEEIYGRNNYCWTLN